VTLTVKKPAVALSSSNLCAGTSTIVTATFTGTPPFSGRWSDGASFSTSSATLQRNVANGGPLSMTFGDANCSGLTSQAIDILQPGTASLAFQNGPPECVLFNSTKLVATVAGGTPPFKITWSDGFVQQSNTSPIVRGVYNVIGVYGITRAQDASCDLTLSNAIISAPAAPVPYFYLQTSSPICSGTEYSAYMYSTLPAGASLTWTVENGTIVSGQGTSTPHFKTADSGTLRVTATVAVSGCASSWQETGGIITPQAKPAQIALSPSTTKAGQPVTITVTGDTPYYTVTASAQNNQLVYVSTPSPKVTVWKYTPTTAGTVTITVHESGNCSYTFVDSTATLTVTP
jgi:hypothetical protein